MPLRSTIDSSDRHSAIAPRNVVAACAVSALACLGLARLNGSQIARWITTWGSNRVTTSTMRSCSPTAGQVERRPLQAAPRGIGVDAEEFADPFFLLEVRGHSTPEIAPHTAHEHTPWCHSG